MRRRAVALGVLSSAAILTAGWQIGLQTQSATDVLSTDAAAPAPASTTGAGAPTTSPTPTGTPTPGTPTPSTPTPTSAPAAGGTASGTASGTFTGTAASTRYGTVQVQVIVANGSIADVVALHLTDHDQRSVQISNRAAPVLRQEVLSAQSANVQSVSGATYTTQGYLTSLQSALDQAGI